MIFLAMLFLFFQPNLSEIQLQFDQGNQRLKEQDYVGAIQHYKQIDPKNWQSGALWLNLGLAYTQLDSLGKAKAYFLNAQKFDATKSDALKSLEYVTKKLPQKAASLPKLPWDYVLEWTIEIGSTTWSWVTLSFTYITLILFVLYLFYKRESKWLLRLFVSAFVLAFAFGSAAIYTDYVHFRYGDAVLVAEQSNLNKVASPDAELVSLAFEGYEFNVDFLKSDGNPDWIYVRMSNGVYGWIKRNDVVIY